MGGVMAATRRSRWTVAGMVGLSALLTLAVLIVGQIGPFRTLFEHFHPDSDGCTIYVRLDFDHHKGHFRPLDQTQLDLRDDSCGGQALRLRRIQPGGAFGAVLPLHVDGVAGLKIAYLCTADGVPLAMLNAWDAVADDNITPKRYQPLSAERWTPVFYHVESFRHNASIDPHSRLGPEVRLRNIVLYGERPGSTDTWMLVDNFVVYRGDDHTPPSQVTGLRAEGDRLSWLPATDNIGVSCYEVACAMGANNLFRTVDTISATSWRDAAPGTGVSRYRVRACDFEGNYGDWSEEVLVSRRER